MCNFDFKRIVFNDLDSWLSCIRKAAKWLLKGFFRLFYAIFGGIVTIVYRIYCFLVKKIRQRPLLSVALVFIFMNFVAIAAIMNVKVQAKTYEHERDSLSYELSKYTQAYAKDTCTIITNDSTYVYIY